MTQNASAPVLVYQMGKVGSSSIAASLRQAGFNVHQVHRLVPENIARVQREHLQRGWPSPLPDAEGKRVYERLIRPRIPLKVITLVREPIGRSFSYYFQNLHKIWNRSDAHRAIPLQELIGGFQIDYPYSDDPLRWFDYEFLPTLGIDVYRHPFDALAGSQILSSGPYDVLLLRTDLNDAAKSIALGQFLNIPAPTLGSSNVTAEKDKRDAYRAFLSSIKLVPEYVEHMLDSKLARHFFDGLTLDSLKNRYLSSGTIIPEAFKRRWGQTVARSEPRVA
jgi:hypothetical protein